MLLIAPSTVFKVPSEPSTILGGQVAFAIFAKGDQVIQR